MLSISVWLEFLFVKITLLFQIVVVCIHWCSSHSCIWTFFHCIRWRWEEFTAILSIFGLKLLRFICHSHRMFYIVSWPFVISILKDIIASVKNASPLRWVESSAFWKDGNTVHLWSSNYAIITNFILWRSFCQHIFKKYDSILCLYLLALNNISKHVFIPLDKYPRVSLPMDQLFISISLNSFHQWINLERLVLS